MGLHFSGTHSRSGLLEDGHVFFPFLLPGRVFRRAMAVSQSKSTGASTIMNKRVPRM